MNEKMDDEKVSGRKKKWKNKGLGREAKPTSYSKTKLRMRKLWGKYHTT
jgi:hypothetical protein